VVSRHDHTNGGEGAPEYGYPLQKAIDARKAGLSSPTSSPSSPTRYLSTANVRVRLNFGQSPFVCPVSWEACLVAKYRRLYEEGVLEGSCALDDSANVWLRRLRAMLIDDGYTAEEVSMGWWWWLGGGCFTYLLVSFVPSFVALLLSLSFCRSSFVALLDVCFLGGTRSVQTPIETRHRSHVRMDLDVEQPWVVAIRKGLGRGWGRRQQRVGKYVQCV
jgi:hypothetical protein